MTNINLTTAQFCYLVNGTIGLAVNKLNKISVFSEKDDNSHYIDKTFNRSLSIKDILLKSIELFNDKNISFSVSNDDRDKILLSLNEAMPYVENISDFCISKCEMHPSISAKHALDELKKSTEILNKIYGNSLTRDNT